MNSFSMTMEPNSPLAELLVNLYARAELAEAEAAALRARVAELEAELAAFTAGEHVATLTLVDGTIHRFYMRPFDEDALRARVAELEARQDTGAGWQILKAPDEMSPYNFSTRDERDEEE